LTIQDTRNAVFKAETELRKAREALDKELQGPGEQLYEELLKMHIPKNAIHRQATNDYKIDKNGFPSEGWTLYTEKLKGKNYSIVVADDGRLRIILRD